MSKDDYWQADLARYPRKPFFKEQSIWVIWIYRFGRRIEKRQHGLYKTILIKLYWPLFRLFETITGISLPKEANIGPGLRIWHFGNIFINPATVIGSHCTLRQGVTIGNRDDSKDVPIIGDNVEFGAYAQVLGSVVIGNNVKIGAMSVVLSDVPDGATAVGVPAKIIKKSK